MDDALQALARAHGVALDYYDIWGNLHHPSRPALLSILAAMGLAVGSEESIASELERTRQRALERLLDPVLVVREGRQPWAVRLQLPDSAQYGALTWRIETEDGALHECSFEANALALLAEQYLGPERIVTRELRIAAPITQGYHRFDLVAAARVIASALLAVVPERCYSPPAIARGGRVWGISAQLYAVRSRRNWGIGDYTDLTTLVQFWGQGGASFIGLNPQHASFPHHPANSSPYSPSSREFRNWIYVDVEAIPEYERSPAAQAQVQSPSFQERLRRLRDADFVDYVGIAAVKRQLIELLYAEFRAHELAHDTDRARAFRAYQSSGGTSLRRFALFDALQEQFASDPAMIGGWPHWPADFHAPQSDAVQRFCRERLERVEFFEYLQWQAESQFQHAAESCRQLGLAVGLYSDLAVSADGGGAECWVNQGVFAVRARVGAPPDELNLKGQDWGLPPTIPALLKADRYAAVLAALRATMRHSGALRIDHVMALRRLYWVPPGLSAVDGVYVHYDFSDLLGLLALESQRNHCMVIGEDLGTVPDEVRQGLEAAGVLSYRVLYFERDQQGEFKPSAWYPRQALVVAATHDLPTLAGWWESKDVALRTALALYPNEQMRERQIAERARDRGRLLHALAREGQLPNGRSTEPDTIPRLDAALIAGIHAYLASTPACAMAVQLEDVLGAVEQVNVPGTVDEYPNWRRKLTLDLEDYPRDPRVAAMITALNGQRRAQ